MYLFFFSVLFISVWISNKHKLNKSLYDWFNVDINGSAQLIADDFFY